MENGRIGYQGRAPRGSAGGWFSRIVGMTLGIVLLGAVLAVGLAFSLVVIPIVLVAALIGGGYFWFKTRNVRRELREQMQRFRESMPEAGTIPGGANSATRPTDNGTVIDGDFIKEAPAQENQRSGRPD